MTKVIELFNDSKRVKERLKSLFTNETVIEGIDKMTDEQLDVVTEKTNEKLKQKMNDVQVLSLKVLNFIDELKIKHNNLLVWCVVMDIVEEFVANNLVEDVLPFADKYIAVYDSIYKTEVSETIADSLMEVLLDEKVGLATESIQKE